MNKHIMMDLETYGTAPGSVLRSIGAVVFELEREEVGAEFYRNIDKVSCLNIGLGVDAATEAWWALQDRAVEAGLLIDPRSIVDVIAEFHTWFVEAGGTHVWCQGANFDEPLWGAAVRAFGRGMVKVPWKFWNVRDTRTVYELAGFDPRSVVRVGAAHNALDDAKFQALCVQKAVAKLTTGGKDED